MSTLLALETSTEFCSAALLHTGKIFVRRAHAGQRHSETVLGMVKEVLDEAALVLSDCDALAFGAGPGSFTGLRIACAVAQGLAYGADLPLFAIDGLSAMAEQLRCQSSAAFVEGTCVLCANDARMGEIYWSLLEWREQKWQQLQAPSLDAPSALCSVVPMLMANVAEHAAKKSAKPNYACGSAFALHAETLADVAQHISPIIAADAEWIAHLAARQWQRGARPRAEAAMPLYVRNRIAYTSDERAAIQVAKTDLEMHSTGKVTA